MFHLIHASQKEENSEEMSRSVAKESSRSLLWSLSNPWDWFCAPQECLERSQKDCYHKKYEFSLTVRWRVWGEVTQAKYRRL